MVLLAKFVSDGSLVVQVQPSEKIWRRQIISIPTEMLRIRLQIKFSTASSSFSPSIPPTMHRHRHLLFLFLVLFLFVFTVVAVDAGSNVRLTCILINRFCRIQSTNAGLLAVLLLTSKILTVQESRCNSFRIPYSHEIR